MKFLFLLLLLPSLAFATETEDKRAHALFRQFRCMVCQSQSLDESDAPLAQDLRAIIRERIRQGESDAAITEYLHSRYGDYILFAPPVTPGTVLLWVGPYLLLGIGALGVVYYIRKRDAY